jgi:precorrin-6B methylase 2
MVDPSLSPARQRRWPPIAVALVLQTIGAALAVGTALVLAPSGVVLHPMMAAFVTGAFAAVLSRVAGQDPWWIVIQLLFTPAVVLVASAQLRSDIWIGMFLGLLAVYWTTFRTQIPLYLSSRKARSVLVTLLPAGPFTFMDVGSGVGGVLIDLAEVRPDGEFHGIESAPLPWLVSRFRVALGRRRNCHAHFGSFWNCDLSRYDVVFAYLSPVPMAALWDKVQREMRPGTTFISNTFPVAAAEAAGREVKVDDLTGSTLHVWTHR